MILDKFIKPKWQHRNPEVRKSAIEKLNDATILSNLAQHDEAAVVRRVAVQKIDDLNLLEHIAQHDTDSTVREVAGQRFKKLLCGQKENGPDLNYRINWLTRLTDLERLEYVVLHGQESELRLAALQKIDRDSLLGDIAIDDPSSDLRVAAMDKITQPATLERVFKASRNRDKRVSRLARDKLDAIVQQQERANHVRKESQAVCERLETFGRGLGLEQEFAELKRLQERWQAVAAEAEPDFQTRFQTAQQVFLTVFEEYQKAREVSRQREQASIDIKDQLYQQANRLFTQLQSLDRMGEEDYNHFSQQLNQLQTQWQGNHALSEPDAERRWQTQFAQLCHKLQDRLQILRLSDQAAHVLEALCVQAETWQNAPDPLIVSQIDDLQARWQGISQPDSKTPLLNHLQSRFDKTLEVLQTRLQEQKKHSEQALHSFKQLLNNLEEALDRGELKTAIPLEQQARDLLKDIENISSYKKFDTRLQKSTTKINELRGWQSWGTKLERDKLCQQLEDLAQTEEDDNPDETLRLIQKIQDAWRRLGAVGYSQDLKERFQTACQQAYQRYREYLCQRMEDLLQQDEEQTPPEERARVIRDAQTTWKNLGSLGHSQELWERFNTACNTAYAPCHIYFNIQAQERQQHLYEKEVVCERLEKELLTDWDSPNWKEIYLFVRQCEHDWKNQGPVDRKSRKSLQKRYHKAMQPWQAHLDEERQRGFQIRQHLIEQVQEVAEKFAADDLDDAIAEVKRLQTQWYVAVPGTRSEERELWKAFRKACDLVFDRRRLQQDAQKRELQANLDQKAALCSKVEVLATLTGEELKTAPSQIRKIQEAFRNIGPVPKKTAEAIERRLENACKQVEFQRQSQLAAEQRRQFDLLRDKAAFCTLVEQELLNSEQLAAAQLTWECLPRLDKPEMETLISQRFETACATHSTGPQTVSEEILNTKKILCLRMEILAGIDSPLEEIEARMAYQVNRLSEALSGGDKTVVKDKLTEAQDLERAWYLSGAVPRGQAEPLEQRFNRALEAFFATRYQK